MRLGGVDRPGRQTVRVRSYRAGMALDRTARQEFLAQPHVAALSVAQPSRGPLSVPIWYQYQPGNELWIITPAESRKTMLIKEAGRFTMLVHRISPTVRYVAVEGPVARIVPGSSRELTEIARRYLPPEQASAYVSMAEATHGEQVVIFLQPENWVSADLGSAS
jgi:hypothetical protein